MTDPAPLPILDLDDQRIAMPDGARLAARIWRPEGGAPVPAILEFIPYRKGDGTRSRDERMHPWWAERGYACIRVDLRGSGDSEGLLTDEYSAQELQDACDIIAWAAAQPWCSGRVGMMGKSWGGFNCLQTAALRPPALHAVLSVCSTTDRFADDIHFKGGALLGENIGWGAVMLSYSSRPADPAFRDDWRADWLNRLDHEPFLAPVWAGHQTQDAYWRHGSVGQDWQAIRAPAMVIGGWADNYMNTVAALVENLTVPVQGIVGPWGHQYPHSAEPAPRIGFLETALRWWDRWLKDAPNGAEADPAYRVWMQHSAPPDACTPHRPGHWVAEAGLPSARVTVQHMALGSGGVLGGAGAPGVTVSSPAHLGLSAGEFFPMGLDAEMPGDQAGDDALSVCFDAAMLDAPLAMLGAARLYIRLVSDQPRAVLVARLCDVAPDGTSTRIAHGILNLCHRDDMAAPSDVPVGTPFDVALTLDQCAHRLAPGHRLRVALSTSYWPFVWPVAVAPRLTVMAGHLALPVHAGTGTADECAFAPAQVPDTLPVVSHGPDRAVRRIERDLIGGTVALVVEDHGAARTFAHGLTAASGSAERWTIHPDDPLSAHVRIDWTQSLSRDDLPGGPWRVETEARAEMSGDVGGLRMTATLVARENGTEVFRRDWDNRVPRRWL